MPKLVPGIVLVIGLCAMNILIAYPGDRFNPNVGSRLKAQASSVESSSTTTAAPTAVVETISFTQLMDELGALSEQESNTLGQQQQATIDSIELQVQDTLQQADQIMQGSQIIMTMATTGLIISIASADASMTGGASSAKAANDQEEAQETASTNSLNVYESLERSSIHSTNLQVQTVQAGIDVENAGQSYQEMAAQNEINQINQVAQVATRSAQLSGSVVKFKTQAAQTKAQEVNAQILEEQAQTMALQQKIQQTNQELDNIMQSLNEAIESAGNVLGSMSTPVFGL